jgi:dipeptidase E
MRTAIVAIGGGEIRTRGTVVIDREILRLSKKRHPRVLFIPTASSDSQRYWKRFQEYFGIFLRCKTDVLFLSREASKERVREKIFSTDVIYVGGGNTLHMMRIWRRRGVDRLLLSAYKRGTVLSGISAGAICWFESGHSDSMSFYNPRKWEYINVKGLGLIKGIHCPHYNGRTRGVARRRDFRTLIERTAGFGIAIENNCAIAFINSRFYQVIRSKTNAKAYRVYKKGDQVIAQQIKPAEKPRPLKDLYNRSRFASARRER